MIFSELYGAYYNAVAKILRAAVDHPVTNTELREIVTDNAFGESLLTIEPALKESQWPLLKEDGTALVQNIPTMPLTTLQKQWLNAISLDPRIRLFSDESPSFPDVEPLFTPEDIVVFDRYSDGDPFTDPNYIARFRLILDAIRNRYPLDIVIQSRRSNTTRVHVLPKYLEYSEKDDKFRLICIGHRHRGIINLGRILSCEPYTEPFTENTAAESSAAQSRITFELYDERNALERVLMHFAHFEKRAEKADGYYLLHIKFHRDDEPEIVIRVLSFGPTVEVLDSEHFKQLIINKLKSQKSCELL